MAGSGSGLKRGQMVAYALPNLALALLFTPVAAILPALYAKHTAATLGAIGAVLVAMRVFDAVSDQLVGYWSDRTASRWGARLPWMVAGAPLLMVSGWFLYTPPASAGVAYFAGWSLAFYTAYTFLNIPYLAWGAEITSEHRERSELFAWHGLAAQAGGFLFFSAPVLLAFAGLAQSSEFGEEQMRLIALAAIAALPVLLLLLALRAPRAEARARQRPDLRGLWDSFRRNGPLRRFVLIYLVSVTGTGTFAAAIIIFLDSHLRLGDKLPWLLIAMTSVSVVAIYPWTLVVKRYGKRRPWALTWLASAAILPLLGLVDPHGPDVFFLALAILLAYSLVEALTNFLPGAVLADIVDYERLRSGCDRAGNFYALHNLVIKTAAAVGGGAGYLMLEWCDYDVKDPAASGPLAVAGLAFTALAFPSLMKLVGALLMWDFPIDERRQRAIRHRLARRDARAAAAAVPSVAPAGSPA